MGSGKLPSNVKIPPSPVAEGGGIHCPESGRVAATVVDPEHSGAVGHLEAEGDRLLLVVNGVVAAEVTQDARLKECVGAGFAYSATLEDAHDPPTIRYRLE